MNNENLTHSAACRGSGIAALSARFRRCADVKDYEFQLVQSEAKKGDAIIAVRLLNKKDRQGGP